MIRSLISVIGNSVNTVWNVSTATYSNLSKSVTAQINLPLGLAFSTGGDKMYIAGSASVYQYNLSTAWDVSTATYSNLSKSVTAQVGTPEGLAFSTGGDKMYVLSEDNPFIICQYNLSTAWDVSTATYSNLSKSLTNQADAYGGLAFSTDGGKMYVIQRGSTNMVYQYNLSTAWDVSTATYSNLSKSVTGASDIYFRPDGGKMYVLDNSTDSVYQYHLSTAWDVSTATYSNLSKSVTAQDTIPYGLAFSIEGDKMYILGYANDTVYQYNL